MYEVRHWLWLPGVLITLSSLFAQSTHHNFEHLTTDHGLSSNKVEAVVQDNDGFYWIATQNGLNRFDGTNIRIYNHQPNDSTSLTHNNCTAIALDSTGDVWVATFHGVSRYRKKHGNFQRIFLDHPTRNHELANRINNLAVDSTGNVWIAGNGLWRYDTRTNKIALFQSNDPSTVTHQAYSVIKQLHYDKDHHGLWMSTGKGIIYFDIHARQFYNEVDNPRSWQIFNHSRDNEVALDHRGRVWFRDQLSQCLAYFDIASNEVHVTALNITSGIRQIQADDENRIWIFYWVRSSVIYEPNAMTVDTTYFNMRHERSVLSEQATSLYIDHDGNHWIASGNGISIYREVNQYYRLHRFATPTKPDNQEPLRIQSIAQSDTGSLWIGTSDGLYTYDIVSGHTQKISIPNTANAVTTLLAVKNKLWIGAHDQLTSIDPYTYEVIEQVILEPGIIFVRQDAHENLWVGLWTRGLFHLDRDGFVLRYFKSDPDSLPGIAANNLISALSDKDRVWIGYNGGLGFSSYTPATGTWKHFHPGDDSSTSDLLSNAGTVTVITKANDDHIWIGTHGGGVFYAHPAANAYTAMSQAAGLNSNYINSILADHAGHYWIATADGIAILDSITHIIHSLDVSMTFRDNDFRQNGIEGVDGKLYFFFDDELIEIDPKRYDQSATSQRLVISQFAVLDNERQLPTNGESIMLTFRENFFSFGFSVIKTHPDQKVQYAYRITGFDNDWIFTERPYANYTNVPHGRYVFQVKVKNENGTWSEPLIQVPIQIHPPFWLTWWFVTLAICSISMLVYALYRYRIQQIKKLMALRARISRDLHDEVGSALSSIHVYSSVAEKAMDKKPQTTRDALKVIHDNTKQVMESMGDIVWAINTGPTNEISLEKKLKNYGFELLTPLGIVTQYDIAPEVDHHLTNIEARKNILLVAKEAMNNIARYSQATTASVALHVVSGSLQMRISDNGIGFDPLNSRPGNGLSNMKNRINSLRGKFDIITQLHEGTTITCQIPLTSIRDN